MLLWCVTAYAQTPTSKTTSFECEVVIDIYNGLKDWETGIAYSGGQLLMGDDKKMIGAVTVVNLNNTDADFNSDGSDIVDLDDNSVAVSPGTTIGRNEIDLMKIVIRKRDPSGPLSGSGNVIFKAPPSVKLWLNATKEVPVTVPPGGITITPTELATEKVYYIEAITASSSMRDIKFEIEYNGHNDYALATAVWVDINTSTQVWSSNTTVPVLGVDLPDADNIWMKESVNNSWVSASGQHYGFGPHYSGQPYYGSSTTYQHALTPILPGIQDKENGGRILFEYTVKPAGAEALVEFDCARQKKARPYQIFDFIETPLPLAPINFPFETGKNIEYANDDGNSISDEDNVPKNSKIYSADRPANWIIQPTSPDLGFKINKITFIEYVRLQIKGKGSSAVGDGLFGSRCSNKVEWHCVYYLRRSTENRKLLADNAVASASEPNKTTLFGGNGNVVINVSNTSSTNYYILMFSNGIDPNDPSDDEWVLINSLGEGGLANRNSDGQSWTLSYDGVTINVFEGTIPFNENDTYLFNVFNSSSKVNEIGLGKLDVTIAP